MKKRIFAIALMMLITLSIFVPTSASAFTYGSTEYNEICIDENGVIKYLSAYNDDYDFYISSKNSMLYAFEKNTITLTNNSVLGTSTIEIIADGHYIIWKYDSDNEVWNYQSTVTKNQGESATFGFCLWNKIMTEVEFVEYDLKQGTYTFNPEILYHLQTITTQEQFDECLNNGGYTTFNIDTYEIYCVYTHGSFTYDGMMVETINYTEFHAGNSVYDINYYNGTNVAGETYNHEWGGTTYLTINDCKVSEEVYVWFTKVTDYNDVNSGITPDVPDQPEYDTNNQVPLYEFYPDRIDRSISGVEDIIFAYYEDDSIPRPSDGSYLVMFKNNDIVFFASSSKPFRKYSGSGSIMLADQSTFDYWAIDGAKIQYLGKTASFTPVEWIAGTHDVLNWSDDSVYQSFENIGTAVFPKTPQTQTQLPKVVGVEMLTGVMMEIVAILPCLIVLLMGLLALRKALAILQEILHQA